MGKKSRRKNKCGGAASAASLPRIDLVNVDNTFCALCGVDIDINHWNENATNLKVCCGRYICCSCSARRTHEREEAKERIAGLQCSKCGPSEPPELTEIYNDINAPCAVCGMPLSSSEKETLSRLVKLAEAGHPNAQYLLAVRYETGDDFVRQDPVKAVEWYRKAVEAGHKKSCVILGDMYRLGDNGVVQSYQEAIQFYELAPDHADAQAALGRLYRDGKGVVQDQTKAMEFFQKYAEQGCPGGYVNYGAALCEAGRVEEALVQFEKGAELEQYLDCFPETIALCQSIFAQCLLKANTEAIGGNDPAKDPFPLALFWARRAVKNGHEAAKPVVAEIESRAHSICRNCKKPNPQMKCSQCRGVSYCDKTCQRAAWRGGHKVVCNALPKLKISSEDECAQCGKLKPGFICEGCGEAYYCNKMCQKAHWEQKHKDECKFL